MSCRAFYRDACYKQYDLGLFNRCAMYVWSLLLVVRVCTTRVLSVAALVVSFSLFPAIHSAKINLIHPGQSQPPCAASRSVGSARLIPAAFRLSDRAWDVTASGGGGRVTRDIWSRSRPIITPPVGAVLPHAGRTARSDHRASTLPHHHTSP